MTGNLWQTVVIAITVVICVAIAAVTITSINETTTAMRNGYTQKTLPGILGAHWIKGQDDIVWDKECKP